MSGEHKASILHELVKSIAQRAVLNSSLCFLHYKIFPSYLLLSDRQYSSTMDLRKQVLTQKSFPGNDETDHAHQMPQRFLSVPDIHVSTEAAKDTKGRTGSKTKLEVSGV